MFKETHPIFTNQKAVNRLIQDLPRKQTISLVETRWV